MISIVVDIALATLCIITPANDVGVSEAKTCYPVLIGGDTPKGEYQLQQRLTDAKGYGGDVLQFKEEGEEVYAIHRVWTLRPWEKRKERLKNPNPKVRRITHGCINVDPKVYDKLVDCCSTSTLTIQ
jgi:hypothetical protein